MAQAWSLWAGLSARFLSGAYEEIKIKLEMTIFELKEQTLSFLDILKMYIYFGKKTHSSKRNLEHIRNLHTCVIFYLSGALLFA